MISTLFNTWQTHNPCGDRSCGGIELDLGCGNGSFTLALAQRYPERLIIGTDVKLGRLRRVDKRAGRAGLGNVSLLAVNSLELVGYMLPDASIDRVHLLCPDPWPKNRHQARRLVTSDFLTRVARVLKPGGVLHMATDHEPYYAIWQHTVLELPFFVACPEGLADIADIQSDFEVTWRAQGKSVPHVGFRRV